MKKLITIILLLAAFFAGAQDTLYKIPLSFDDNNQAFFEEVIDIPGFNATQIYSCIKSEISNIYKSSEAVIDLDDKENGKIFIKGIINYTATDGIISITCMLSHTLKIFIKDEKIKVRFENLSLVFTSGSIIPIEQLITDDHLYKKNGKPVNMMKSHKENVIISWRYLKSQLVSSIKKEDNW